VKRVVAPASSGPGRWLLTVGGLGVCQIVSWGGSYYLPAVLAQPIARDTGWSLDWIVGGLSMGLLVSGLIARRVGGAIDRLGGRPVLAAGSVLLAGGLVVVGLSQELAVYLFGWVVIGLGMGATLYDAAFSTLGRLYGTAARRAITHLTLVAGFASTASWPLSAVLVENVGWRGTCLAYAALQLLVALPLHLLVIPREPRSLAPAETEAPPTSAASVPSRRPALFALLAAILASSGLIMSLWSVHLVTILREGGLGLSAAVSLAALIGPAQVAARVVELAFGARHHPILTLALAAALIALGFVLLWLGLGVPAVALICYGAGNGVWSIARGTLPLELYGASGYPIVMGKLATPNLVIQALAPSIGAVLLGAVGASGTLGALAALALANVVAVGLLWAMIRHGPPRSLASAAGAADPAGRASPPPGKEHR